MVLEGQRSRSGLLSEAVYVSAELLDGRDRLFFLETQLGNLTREREGEGEREREREGERGREREREREGEITHSLR